MGMLSYCKKDYGPTRSPAKFASVYLENVTTSAAVIKGTVLSSDPAAIIEKGIYLSELGDVLVKNPLDISGLRGVKQPGISEGESSFVVSLTNLKPDTRYAYLPYVETTSGKVYGKMKILVTSYGTVTDGDGNIYQTIRIGTQIWMRENLRSVNYSDHSAIAGYYDSENDGTLGKHYSWDAANGMTPAAKTGRPEGACPTGWHIPGDGEWQQLLTFAGVPSDQLNSLNLIGDDEALLFKAGGTGSWADEMAYDGTGFSVLPAGIVKKCQAHWNSQTAFWTSTPNIFYGFQSESEKIERGNHPNCICGLSIRCVKDQN